MIRFAAACSAIFIAVLLLAGLESAAAQTITGEQLGGPGADVNCPQLQSQADAQELYDATIATDGADIYDLDGSPADETACNGGRTELGTEPLASCANLRRPEHAKALFEAGGADDPYNLDPNGNGIPCDEGAAEEPLDDQDLLEPIPSDLPTDQPTVQPPPVTAGAPGDCDVEVRAGRAFVLTDCADGTVSAGFEPFAGFDDFAARAQNGFGAFDGDAGSGTTTIEVQQSVPSNLPSGDTTRRSSDTGETRLVEGEQRTRGERAKRAKKGKRKKARKAKRSKRAREQAKRARQARDDRDD